MSDTRGQEQQEQAFFLKQLSKIYLNHSVSWSDGIGDCEGTVQSVYIEHGSEYPRYFADVKVERASVASHPFLGKTVPKLAADLTPKSPLTSTQRRWMKATLPPSLIRPEPEVPKVPIEPTWKEAVFLYASEKFRDDEKARLEFLHNFAEGVRLDQITLHEVHVSWQRCARIKFWLRQLDHYEESIKRCRRIPYHPSRHVGWQVLQLIPGIRRKLIRYRETGNDSVDVGLELADLEHLVRRSNFLEGESLIGIGQRLREVGQTGGLGTLAVVLDQAHKWLIERGNSKPTSMDVMRTLRKVDPDNEVIGDIDFDAKTITYVLASGAEKTVTFKAVQNHLSLLKTRT